jgi:hypothetical protein
MFPQSLHFIAHILNADLVIAGTMGFTENVTFELPTRAMARGSACGGVDAIGDANTAIAGGARDEPCGGVDARGGTCEGETDRGLEDNGVNLAPSGEDCRDDLEGPGFRVTGGCDDTAVQCGSGWD